MFLIYKGGKDFYQWDMGQRLQIVDENYNRVHFCTKNCTTALVCNVYTENGVRLVNVPNTLLQKPCIVKAYGCIAEGGEIYYAKEAQYFRVIERAKPDDYIYTEEELKNWNGIDERLAQIEEDVAELEAIGYDNLARKTEVQAVENRLDNAIAATTLDANAELIDIRVGANGESYTNAGNAVRAKVNKTDIVSSTGNSEDKVMSQKATSKKFNTLEGKVSKNEKQIANLINAREQELFVEDDTVAYQKDVPENALPFAEIGEVGGITRKCTNLIPFPYGFGNSVTNGVTITVNDDGGVTYNGTSTTQINPYFTSKLLLPKGTYTLSGAPSGASWSKYILIVQTEDYSTILAEDYGSGKTFTLEADTSVRICLIIANGATVSNLTVYPMLNEGDTALPYMPYFEGLRDAKVTAVESLGVNLCNLARIPDTLNGLTFNKNTDGSVTINGTCNAYTTIYFEKINIKTGEKFYFLGGQNGTIFTFNGNRGGTFIKNLGTADDTSVYAITCDGTYDNFYPILLIQEGTVLSNVTVCFMVSKTPFTSFSPYFKNTFPIPEAVQALEGYGQGVNKEYCNKIVLDTATGVKKYVKNVKSVKVRELTWNYYSNNIVYASSITGIKIPQDISTPAPIVTQNYTATGSYYIVGLGAKTDKTICIYNGAIWLYDTDIDSAQELIDIHGDDDIIVALATPVETDLTDLITDDNFIGVESVGTITAVNEYKLDAPSLITYQLKEV